MKPIFKENKLLQKYAESKTALVFDFDGTLCPVVALPEHAELSAETRRLLKTLIRLYPCAVLSGRSVAGLKKMVRGIGFQALVGNHGIEFENSKMNVVLEKRVRGWIQVIQQAFKDGRIKPLGIELEEKTVSLSLHYRFSPHPTKTARQIQAVLKELPGLRVVGGKYVFNLLPDVHKNKGTAILELKKRLKCDYVFFAGDDLTDEDVFKLKNKSKILDVHIGRSKTSYARYNLPEQGQMDFLIEKLIKYRT
jgi:trehalose 6-phosphate phosphatase